MVPARVGALNLVGCISAILLNWTRGNFIQSQEALPSQPMASTRDRLDELEHRLQQLDGTRTSTVLTDRHLGTYAHPVPWWAKTLVGVLAAIIVGYAGWLGVETYNDNARISRVEQRLSDLSEAVDQVQKSVQSLQSSISLRKLADLEPKQFAAALPTLRKLVSESPTKVEPDPDTLTAVAEKLRKVPETSQDYWPTVLRFIQFASTTVVAPNDVPPASSVYMIISNLSCADVVNCFVVSHRAVELDGGSIPNSIFDHCRIRFTNNPVNLSGTKFTDCVFEMPKVAMPSPYLKSATKVLLASNLKEVTFPTS